MNIEMALIGIEFIFISVLSFSFVYMQHQLEKRIQYLEHKALSLQKEINLKDDKCVDCIIEGFTSSKLNKTGVVEMEEKYEPVRPKGFIKGINLETEGRIFIRPKEDGEVRVTTEIPQLDRVEKKLDKLLDLLEDKGLELRLDDKGIGDNVYKSVRSEHMYIRPKEGGEIRFT